MKFNRNDFLADKAHRKKKFEAGVEIQPHIPLYHGSPIMKFKPMFGKGETKHDYGAGFYTSFDLELAKAWAVCNTDGPGYVHKYLLETRDLSILAFNDVLDAKDQGILDEVDMLARPGDLGVLTWLATLAKHRKAADSRRYEINAAKLIERYYDPKIEDFDVIIGYRADDSYFSFAKQVINGNANVCLLERMMKAGELGDQIFIQSEKAFNNLVEVDKNEFGYSMYVENETYRPIYNERDKKARLYVNNLLRSDENDLSDTIEKYLD